MLRVLQELTTNASRSRGFILSALLDHRRRRHGPYLVYKVACKRRSAGIATRRRRSEPSIGFGPSDRRSHCSDRSGSCGRLQSDRRPKVEGGEIRFSLTSEVGLNDGVAFSVHALAIALTTSSFGSFGRRLVVARCRVEIGCGGPVLTCKFLRHKPPETGDGFGEPGRVKRAIKVSVVQQNEQSLPKRT